MGNCYSLAPRTAPMAVHNADSSLNTGDLVLLLDDSRDSSYITKAGKGWVRASITGFVVRDGAGVHALTLYHADHRTEEGYKVVACNLEQELQSGRYRRAVVRRLHRKLTPDQTAMVREFALLNVGKICCPLTPAPKPATVLMANTGGVSSSAYERFICSEFVATALHLAGQIEPSSRDPAALEYAACNAKGAVLGPPRPIRLLNRLASSPRSGDGGSSAVMTGERDPKSVLVDTSNLGGSDASVTATPTSKAAVTPRMSPAGSGASSVHSGELHFELDSDSRRGSNDRRTGSGSSNMPCLHSSVELQTLPAMSATLCLG